MGVGSIVLTITRAAASLHPAAVGEHRYGGGGDYRATAAADFFYGRERR